MTLNINNGTLSYEINDKAYGIVDLEYLYEVKYRLLVMCSESVIELL